MTRPEPAGVGTADQNAWLENRACSLVTNPGVAEGYRTVIARLIMQAAQEYAGHLISAERTASRRQAKEEDAKWLDQQSEDARVSGNIFAAVAIAKLAAGLRSSINPPGEKE